MRPLSGLELSCVILQRSGGQCPTGLNAAGNVCPNNTAKTLEERIHQLIISEGSILLADISLSEKYRYRPIKSGQITLNGLVVEEAKLKNLEINSILP